MFFTLMEFRPKLGASVLRPCVRQPLRYRRSLNKAQPTNRHLTAREVGGGVPGRNKCQRYIICPAGPSE